MTDTGLSCGLDSLGRFVIPYELRGTLDIRPKQTVYIYTSDGAVYMRKVDGTNMTDTGITRPLDNLGRVVVPKKLRTDLDIKPEDQLRIFTEEKSIVLRKVTDHCIFCRSEASVIFHGKGICKSCCSHILKMLEKGGI